MTVAIVRFFIVVLLFAAAVSIPVFKIQREEKRRMKQQARAVKLATGDQCPVVLGKVDNKCLLCRYYGGRPEPFTVLCHGVNRRTKE